MIRVRKKKRRSIRRITKEEGEGVEGEKDSDDDYNDKLITTLLLLMVKKKMKEKHTERIKKRSDQRVHDVNDN